MITILDRKELINTMDFNRRSDICCTLASNGVAYTTKTTNPQTSPLFGSTRSRTGSFGINPDLSYEYKIYVSRNDYERALRMIG